MFGSIKAYLHYLCVLSQSVLITYFPTKR